jgi:hypothetical protein
VHGTWGRGIFPGLRVTKTPYWFEPGGLFREKLLSDLQLRGFSCSFDVFPWSGSNSIRRRDEAASQLAERLASNFKQLPRVHQIVIAHSHGGNVAASALGRLDNDLSTIHVCYLATPFLQLFPRMIERSERWSITAAVFSFLVMFIFILIVLSIIALDNLFGLQFELDDVHVMASSFLAYLGAWRAYGWLGPEKCRVRNEPLVKATTALRLNQSPGAAFILRAVDDEASLALAFGTIANLLSARLMSLTMLLLMLTMVLAKAIQLISPATWRMIKYSIYAPVSGTLATSLFMLLLVASFSRGVFGRELILQSGTQMNVQSVPDFMRRVEIQTLLRENSDQFFALRHGIHSHPKASTVVAEWICRAASDCR